MRVPQTVPDGRIVDAAAAVRGKGDEAREIAGLAVSVCALTLRARERFLGAASMVRAPLPALRCRVAELAPFMSSQEHTGVPPSLLHRFPLFFHVDDELADPDSDGAFSLSLSLSLPH